MTARERTKYVAVGSVLTESVTSKLVTMGATYQHKLLESSPENWDLIAEALAGDDVAGAIVKLTKRDYERMCRDEYAGAADRLLEQLTGKPNLLLVHEAVAGYAVMEAEESDEDDDAEWNDRIAREYFGDVPPEVRQSVHSRLDRFGLTITTYKKNAEASLLASSFVEDVGSNLLFRFYVPAGRIFEDELSRMLDLFHDWLGAAAGRHVRRDGYRTPSGRVIEFFGDQGVRPGELSVDIDRFSEFLTIVEDQESAMRILEAMGVPHARADALVARYRRDVRRILLDTRHERERRVLQMRHELESELAEEPAATAELLAEVVDQLVPLRPFIQPQNVSGTLGLRELGEHPASTPSVVVYQQFFDRVEGFVAQNLAGTVHVGTSLDQVLHILSDLDGPESEASQAARELADGSAPPAARVRARQHLKSFLVRNAQRMEQAAFNLAMKWVEGQLG